eukprot:6655382-Ditylum_brightwellii.AAC.1
MGKGNVCHGSKTVRRKRESCVWVSLILTPCIAYRSVCMKGITNKVIAVFAVESIPKPLFDSAIVAK